MYFVIRWDLRGRVRKIKQKGIPPGKHFMCPDIFYTGVKVKRGVYCFKGDFFGDVDCNTGSVIRYETCSGKARISSEDELAGP